MSIDIETKGENMRKRTAGVVAAILSASLALSGCGLLPFQQDVPFQKSESKDTETKNTEETEQQTDEEADADTTQDTDTAEDTQQDTDESEEQTDAEEESPLEQASLMAAQYDYDGAIELLKSQSDYDSNTDMQNAVSEYENIRATCTEYPLEQITHVFFHTLIKDPSKAFDGESDSDGYNQYMTTIGEFNKIIQSMYDKGYVMVSPHDMAIVNEDGTMSRGSIMLPPGKIPFVLSQDDVSYYHYMDGDGFASKLVVDENGEVKNEYIEDDGSVSTGDYDMVPLIDTFVKEHPDFSYHGRKGILAMTEELTVSDLMLANTLQIRKLTEQNFSSGSMTPARALRKMSIWLARTGPMIPIFRSFTNPASTASLHLSFQAQQAQLSAKSFRRAVWLLPKKL